MLYNVATLLKAPVGADLRQPIEGLIAIESADAAVVGLVTGEVRFQRANQGILAMGTFHTRLRLQCARCLDDVERDLDDQFSEMYYPTIDILSGLPLARVNTDQGFTIDAHHHLDLTEAIRQQIILDLPMQPLCRADCAGLCPICGGNRNEQPCDCEAREAAQDSPFAQLANLHLPE